MFGSFKFKLVGTFLALSVLPLAAAFWGFSEVADRSVTGAADSRLEAGLSAALAAYGDERRSAERAAERLGRTPAFQAAVARRDRAALQNLLRSTPSLRVEAPGGFTVGNTPKLATETTISLVGPGTRSATIVVAVPLNEQLIRRLLARSGLTNPDELAVVGTDRRVGAASDPEIQGLARFGAGRVTTAKIGDRSYRVISTQLAPDSELALAAVTPTSAIVSEQRSVIGRLLVGLLGSLLLIACVAYIAGRSIVGSLARLANAANSIAAGRLRERVPIRGRDEFAELGRAFNEMATQLEARLEDLEAERRRLREANVRFGDALAATLDPQQLRRVIVESAVEASQAVGGVFVGDDGSVAETGDLSARGERLDFQLTSGRSSFGHLMLIGESFSPEQRMAAAALARQAGVALENARLHRIVARQALVDGLTGLATRRQEPQELPTEVARAERLGGPVALILADVDDFKRVNDRFGHPTGDIVLRDLAQALWETVREIDTAARWGGEEFAVILPGTDLEGAAQVAERIRQALSERMIVSADGVPLTVTASFGVAAGEAPATPEQLIESADDALYRAKRAGKDCVFAGTIQVTPR